MKGFVSVFLIMLLIMLPGQLMADVTPSISIELSGRAAYRDIEGIPSAEGGAMLEVRPGMEFGAGWGLSFPVYAGVAKELLPMHPFLSIPAVTTVGAGIAGEYSIGRWILTLSETIEYSMLNGNAFGPMENLGEQINTTGDEMFPYVRDSVTLYFASNGHPGMGGLDLFVAKLDSTGNWNVSNLGAPINSMGDDFGITFEGSREKGFFSSNRNDARGYDHIYSFELPTITIKIEGYVYDVDEYPIENATVRIVGRDGLNEKALVKKDGFYQVELERDIRYVMMASARGYLNQSFELKTDPEEKNETYIVDFFLSPIYEPVVVENIFYDFDKATLRPESKAALDEMIKMLNDNPNVTIELGAHTDRKGTDRYNEGLAQRRAQSVVDYLIAGGIARDRLEAKGYGESVPKTINKRMAEEHPFLKEGDVLTEEFVLALPPEQQEIADQINRRTEFKVLRTNYNLY